MNVFLILHPLNFLRSDAAIRVLFHLAIPVLGNNNLQSRSFFYHIHFKVHSHGVSATASNKKAFQ